MKLRPHHLLCIQAYEGNGYSEAFVLNMNEVVDLLNGEQDVLIELNQSLDVLCEHCPHALAQTCDTEQKVQTMDQKVLQHFNLKCGKQSYRQAIQVIQNQITPKVLEDICGHCSWYAGGQCANLILNKKSH